MPTLPVRPDLNPFHYSLAELQKALIALVGFLGFAAFYLFKTDFDPGLVPALQALVPTGFAVVTVFLATQATEADLKKALLGFISASVGVFEALGQKQVNPETLETLAVIAGYFATFYFVYLRPNVKPPIDDQREKSFAGAALSEPPDSGIR